MKLMDVLQGKWLGHPLHPAVVHVPLCGWIAAAVADVCLALGVGGVALARFSFVAVIVGLLGALIAIPTGVADWAPIKKEKPAWKLGLYHMLLNVVAVVVWALNFGLRLPVLDDPEPVTAPIVATSVIGAALLAVSGYIGSLMVFDHGVSVARLSKSKWRQIAVRGGARVPEEK